jgi:hypothetical protein
MKSTSERFVSAVVGFLAGTHLHRKPRPTTYSLFRESRDIKRELRRLEKEIARYQKVD